MGIKRIVDTSFWTDGKMDDFSPEDKYFWLYLLTNPFSKQLGIYEISIKQAAFQMGYSVDAFNVLLDRFENKYKIILFSRETNEVAILNFLRHSVMKGGKPVEDCIRKEMALVKNKGLIDAVFSRLYGRDDLNVTVAEIINEYMKKKEIDNDSDNDIDNGNENENERTHGVSVYESFHESSHTPEKPVSKPAKETTRTLFKRLLPDYVLSDDLQAKIEEWITYKTERKEPYKEIGMKSLLRQIENNSMQYGSQAICNLIDESMANGWKGIIFDRLKQKPVKQAGFQRQTKADELEDFYAMANAWANERGNE